MLAEIKLLPKQNNIKDWSIGKDINGEGIIFYKNIPIENIIYAVGEIILSYPTDISTLQEEYYDRGDADIFNIALKLVRNKKSKEVFYNKCKKLEVLL